MIIHFCICLPTNIFYLVWIKLSANYFLSPWNIFILGFKLLFDLYIKSYICKHWYPSFTLCLSDIIKCIFFIISYMLLFFYHNANHHFVDRLSAIFIRCAWFSWIVVATQRLDNPLSNSIHLLTPRLMFHG